MKTGLLLPIAVLLFAWSAPRCHAEPPWSTGHTLQQVIMFDLKAHEGNTELTDYQTSAVCMLLGYFRGFAESAAVSEHYNVTALPYFLPDSATDAEIEHVVYKYLEDNPAKLDLKGDALVVAALTRAFPNTVFKAPPRADASPAQ